MAVAKVFMSGRSQAVRLPKQFRVSGNELAIAKVGRSIVLTPIDVGWPDFFRILHEFDTNMSIERNQPQLQQDRESLVDN